MELAKKAAAVAMKALLSDHSTTPFWKEGQETACRLEVMSRSHAQQWLPLGCRQQVYSAIPDCDMALCCPHESACRRWCLTDCSVDRFLLRN